MRTCIGHLNIGQLSSNLSSSHLEWYDIDTGQQIPFRFFGFLFESIKTEATAVQMTFACSGKKMVSIGGSSVGDSFEKSLL